MKISKKLFKEWLKNKLATEIVGFQCDPCLCPIANYIKFRKPNIKDLEVYSDYAIIDGKEVSIEQDWLQTFITTIDDMDLDIPESITVSEALFVIEVYETRL